MSFADLGLLPPLLRNLVERDYGRPTPIQAAAIPGVLAGQDLMATAQTGTGKTAAFALPLLQRLLTEGQKVASNQVRALILVPTRELAEQVHVSVRAYGEGLPLRYSVAYGGVSLNPQMMALRKGVDVLVATPGRLLDLQRQNAVRFDSLQVLVLDEADRMLDLGFARELDALVRLLPRTRQTLLFSATFSDAIRELARGLLSEPVVLDIGPRNTAATTVRQWLVPVDKRNKADLFIHLLTSRRWSPVLVFARTRKGVDQLQQRLEAEGLPAESIHGDKPQPARLRALERFKRGEVSILVATDVAARGLDIDGLPQVVNFDLPTVAEDYVHRIGRTGRAGAAGEAISLVCADEVEQLVAIEALIRQLLPRREEPGFSPEHRVPSTVLGSGAVKKPKKPKQKGATGASTRIHLGGLADEARPDVKPVRALPGFGKGRRKS